MKVSRTALILFTVIAFLVLTFFLNSKETVSLGNYYLEGNENNEHIQIISNNKMRFVKFDIVQLSDFLVYEGAGLAGREAEVFKERHNLPYVFNEEIEFDYNQNDKAMYLNALSDDDDMAVNYRLIVVDKNTIMFMEDLYIRP